MTRIESIIFTSNAGEFEYLPKQNLIIVESNYLPPRVLYAAALELLFRQGANTPPPAGREVKVGSMYISYTLPNGRVVEGEYSDGALQGKEYAQLVWEGDTVPPAPDLLLGVLKRMLRAAIISRAQLRSWSGGEPDAPVAK